MRHQVYAVFRKVVNEINVDRVLVCGFMQRCTWSIRSSRIWCPASGWLVPDVLEQSSSLFKV